MVTVGIDEAGRGCWAGPLVAAAVVLRAPIAGLTDSKQLSKRRRHDLAKEIYANAAVGVGWVEAAEIDAIGLTQATTEAMTEALNQISTDYQVIIIDGNFNYLKEFSHVKTVKTLVKADSLIPEVSAASIIAKTERDQYMTLAAAKFPEYQFESHVGYGTRLHFERLKQHGSCELHRLSYKPLQALLWVEDV